MSTKPEDASALTQRMVREYKQGATLTELSLKHGMGLPAVRQRLVDAGVTIRRKGGTLPTDQSRVVEMKRLYLEEGLTLQQIGDRYNLSRQRVQQILRGAGVESLGRRAVPTDDGPEPPRNLTAQEREIAARYDKGTRPADLMDEFGITYPTLQTILRRAGVQTKPKGYFNRRPDYDRIRKGVIKDYQRGIDTGVIAERYGLCGRTEIYKFVRREGIPLRHHHEAMPA